MTKSGKNSLRIHKWTHNEFNIFILGVLTHPHCHNIEHIENLYIENLWEQDSKCSCSFFHFCINLCYITLRLCNFYNSIYSNKSLLNVKIGQYWQKIQASLALFEENMLFLQGSRICASIWIYSILISRQPTPS